FQNAVGPHQRDKGLDFAFLPGNLDHEIVRTDVNDPAPKHLDQEHDFRALLRPGRDLDQHQVALDKILAADILDSYNRYDFVQLLADLFELGIVAVHDEGHAGEIRIFGFADGQAVDVEAARRQH